MPSQTDTTGLRTTLTVVRADAMGMCFGVRDALTEALRYPAPETVTIRGELVHNESVIGALRARGFVTTPESSRAPAPRTPAVMITAHGISDRERARLRDRGLELIDTTCPLVRRAHDAARQLADAGYHVVVVGRPGHVEVRGLTGDLRSCQVIPDPLSVGRIPYPRIGVICQTTTPERLAREVVAEIRARNPDAEVRFVDTICEPTKRRQRAIEDLARRVDAVVVVGGAASNNTRELARRCEAAGTLAIHVRGPADVDLDRLGGLHVIGLTAGTSTPDHVIDAVEVVLRSLGTCSEAYPPR